MKQGIKHYLEVKFTGMDDYWDQLDRIDVQGTHVIVVSEAVNFVIYQKINGVWTELTATIWKKTTGWNEQDDPGSTVSAGDYELINL